ncbi:MAG: hypothetical protein ACE5F1_09355 [Planctomycetota bacterium]
MVRRPSIQITLSRVSAAGSFFFVAGAFALEVLGFLAGGHRADEGFRSMASWPLYELLASAYGILLPFSHAFRRALEKSGLTRLGRRAFAALFLVPFFLVAWALCVPVFGTSWFVLGFLAFALVHLISYECEEARLEANPRASPLRRSVFGFVKCYGLAMAAAFLAVFVVFGPMDIMGVFVRSGVRLEFMSVAIGTLYFLLLGVTELIDLDGFVEAKIEEGGAILDREREWIRARVRGEARAVSVMRPLPGARRIGGRRVMAGPGLPIEWIRQEEFEEWAEQLPVSGETRKQIQYWDLELVRFGQPFRTRRRDRRICFGGALLCAVMAMLCLLVALHPQSFKKKYARKRHPFAPQVSTATEQSDRDAFKFMAGFVLLLGTGLGIGWWVLRRDVLGKAHATVDRCSGTVSGPDDSVLEIRAAALALEQAASPQAAGPGDHWELLARGGKGRSVRLLVGVSLRDAEILARLLQEYGFRQAEALVATRG